jgi:hypothetical protein
VIGGLVQYMTDREIPPALAEIHAKLGDQDLYFFAAHLLGWLHRNQPDGRGLQLDERREFQRRMRGVIESTPALSQILVVTAQAEPLPDCRGSRVVSYAVFRDRVPRAERAAIMDYVTRRYDVRLTVSFYA